MEVPYEPRVESALEMKLKVVRKRFPGKGADNEVLYLGRPDAQKNVIFFPGDIQDIEERMISGHESEWINYSLENTAVLLYDKFKEHNCNIIVIRPDRRVGSVNEYDNHLRPGKGIAHLESVYQGVLKDIQSRIGCHFDEKMPIILVGFSKGSLVLNHFIAELATVIECSQSSQPPQLVLDWEPDRKTYKLPNYEPSRRIARTNTPASIAMDHKDVILQFMSRVTAIHWVDGHRFPTDQQVIRAASSFLFKEDESKHKTKIYVHYTPRQVQDSRRKWIKIEQDLFVETLKTIREAVLVTKSYFEDEPPSLEFHFKCLDSFVE